jgi:hypothetical protein
MEVEGIGYNINSENFFQIIENVENDEKNIIDLIIYDITYLDQIVNKLLELDKIILILNFRCFMEKIPESIFKLVNIYELTIRAVQFYNIYIPDDISKLVNLNIMK